MITSECRPIGFASMIAATRRQHGAGNELVADRNRGEIT
jgi:hypothetical protein